MSTSGWAGRGADDGEHHQLIKDALDQFRAGRLTRHQYVWEVEQLLLERHQPLSARRSFPGRLQSANVEDPAGHVIILTRPTVQSTRRAPPSGCDGSTACPASVRVRQR